MREWIEENRGFWLLLACTLIPIFFQLDRLLGAEVLVPIYPMASLMIAIALLAGAALFGPYISQIERMTIGHSITMVVLFCVFVLIGYLCRTGIMQFWVLAGLICSLLSLPVFAVPVAAYIFMIVILVVLKLAHALRVIKINPFGISGKWMVRIALVMTIVLSGIGTAYLMVIGVSHMSRLQVGDHLYELQHRAGDSGNIGTLMLYQCTPPGLWCQLIYEQDEWGKGSFQFTDMKVELTSEADSNAVRILVDGEVQYTYVSASKP